MMKTKFFTLLTLLYAATVLFGLAPVTPITITTPDSAAGRDVILERAIQRLSGQ